MKKIIKTEGILTNVMCSRANAPAYPRNPAWAFVTHKYNGHMVTSKNTVGCRFDAQNGYKITVWYVQGYPYKVYKNPMTALCCLYWHKNRVSA